MSRSFTDGNGRKVESRKAKSPRPSPPDVAIAACNQIGRWYLPMTGGRRSDATRGWSATRKTAETTNFSRGAPTVVHKFARLLAHHSEIPKNQPHTRHAPQIPR